MNTSITIPLGSGSRNNDLELRYCLRSVERYLTGYGDVFIIGRKPDWLKNVIHIPYDEGFAPQSYEKERNIFNKIMVACEDERVSNSFLFMNDDHFLLKKERADRYPYYYDGYLMNKMTVTEYKNTVNNTIARIGAVPFYADVHCPIKYNKRSIKQLSKYNWGARFGYCIKTLYTHSHVEQRYMTPIGDLKIDEYYPADQIKEKITNRPWFSIGDKAFNGEIATVLQELYPTKSKYE